jgi:hypothetical protein
MRRRIIPCALVAVLLASTTSFAQPAEPPLKDADSGRSSDAMRRGLSPDATPSPGLPPGMLGGSTTTAETGGGKAGTSGAASRMGGASATSGTSDGAPSPPSP